MFSFFVVCLVLSHSLSFSKSIVTIGVNIKLYLCHPTNAECDSSKSITVVGWPITIDRQEEDSYV